MKVLQDFRRIAEALEGIHQVCRAAIRNEHEHAELSQRLDEVEVSRALHEAEMEGLLLKAEGKLKAAANAEARERTMRKSYEEDIDPFPEGRVEGQDPVPGIDAEGSEEEELQPLHLDLEKNSKAYALRAKWA